MPHLVKRAADAVPRAITCGTLRELIKPPDFGPADLVHVTVKGTTVPHWHKELTEFYYVLSGALEVELDGVVERLTPGSILMIRPGTPHTARGHAELLVVCVPPWRPEDEIAVGPQL